MFIKKLMISSPTQLIRDIEFKTGLNLILDDTPIDDLRSTGNNIGKTTVLKLVDFCLGANSNIIYMDTENKKEVYKVVKDFVVDEEILITLILTKNLDDIKAEEIIIQRNFLSNKKAIRKINGKSVLDKEYEYELERILMPEKEVEKPTFRQIVSHNIRYKDESINNTLKTLDKYTSDAEYEALYLYLLGCNFHEGAKKQVLITQINQEETFKERLEKKQTKTTYEIALGMVDEEISALNEKKTSFNLNESLEQDLDMLNKTRVEIGKISSIISKLEIRKSLIEESRAELEQSVSNIDLHQLRMLYEETVANISQIHKTFEDLVTYHNNMIIEKINYIVQDLPELTKKLEASHEYLLGLLKQEKLLTDKMAKGDSFEELEKVISGLNESYRVKGEYESVIAQLNEVENNIRNLNAQMSHIDRYLFSGDFEVLLKEQVMKFNKFFSSIAQELYGEKYALTYKKVTNKNGQQFYRFNAFNANLSSGKKQGEILCFDLAYLLFAGEEKLPCLHFLLNDKKELMHDNQLLKVADFVESQNIQLIVSILKDKLPRPILEKAHIAVELSQRNKLFRIEK